MTCTGQACARALPLDPIGEVMNSSCQSVDRV